MNEILPHQLNKLEAKGDFAERLVPLFKKRSYEDFYIEGNDCWEMKAKFKLKTGEQLEMRNVNVNDVTSLIQFRDLLSQKSRDLFCPYPWDDDKKLEESLHGSIQSSLNHTDASFLIMAEDAPAGHFFLWKAGGNAHSIAFGADVPELGVAVVDRLQGQGLGGLAVDVLEEVAKSLNKDAIELTTAMTNDAGWNTYLNSSFVYTGIIKNPLEVDVSEATAGNVQAQKYREERQMVYMINKDKEREVLDYLALKRNT